MLSDVARRVSTVLQTPLYLRRAFRHFKKHGQPLDFPLVLQLQTQSRCNAACRICPYADVSRRLEQGTADTGLVERIIDDTAQGHECRSLVLMLQNEPLLDERVFQFVKRFKSLAPAKRCALVTNGERIDTFTTREIAESGIDQLVVSLNAHSEAVFNAINRGIDYARVLRNIDGLLGHDVLKHKLVIRFALTRQNKREIPGAVRYWRARGARVAVRGLSNRVGLLKSYREFKSSNRHIGLLRGASNEMVSFALRHVLPGCPLPFFAMNVLFNGDVVPCCHDWNRNPVVGNVRQSSLRDAWHSSEFNALRRAVIVRDYADIPACCGCSVVGLGQGTNGDARRSARKAGPA